MNKTRYIQITVIILTGVCVLVVNPAHARSEITQRDGHHLKRHHNVDHRNSHNYHKHHKHSRYGHHVTTIPRNSFSLTFGGLRFYYDDGLYYRRAHNGYILVEPPRGVRVKRIPVDYQPIVYNGITYYTDGGVYYVYTSSGYQVVPPPAMYVQAQNSVLVSAPSVVERHMAITTMGADQKEMYTVNIPNDKTGGYTEVTIKRTDKGFLGPQGEFYAEFPRVEQLKAMYII